MQLRPTLALIATGAALTLAACGGDDGDSTATDSATTDAATSETTASSSAGEMTAGEFMAASIPDMSRAVKDLVAETPECEGIDASDGGKFQQAFAIDAAMAAPDTPLSEIIVDSCEENLVGKGTA